jgi:hypothetical protein
MTIQSVDQAPVIGRNHNQTDCLVLGCRSGAGAHKYRHHSGHDTYEVDRAALLITLATAHGWVIIDRCPALT